MTTSRPRLKRASKAGIDFIGLGVAAVVLNEAGEIALLQRARRAGKGLWSLPGGRVRVGETLEAAVLREVNEELGVRGTVQRCLGLVEDIATDGHWISALYLIGDLIGVPRNREPHMHTAMQWFALDSLPADLMLIARVATERLGHKEELRSDG